MQEIDRLHKILTAVFVDGTTTGDAVKMVPQRVRALLALSPTEFFAANTRVGAANRPRLLFRYGPPPLAPPCHRLFNTRAPFQVHLSTILESCNHFCGTGGPWRATGMPALVVCAPPLDSVVCPAQDRFSAIACSLLSLAHWYCTSERNERPRQAELFRLILSQEVYDPLPLSVEAMSKLAADPKADPSGGAHYLVPPSPNAVVRSGSKEPSLALVGKALESSICRIGEDADRLLDLLLKAHDMWKTATGGRVGGAAGGGPPGTQPSGTLTKRVLGDAAAPTGPTPPICRIGFGPIWKLHLFPVKIVGTQPPEVFDLLSSLSLPQHDPRLPKAITLFWNDDRYDVVSPERVRC